jgi:hypothetical protein
MRVRALLTAVIVVAMIVMIAMQRNAAVMMSMIFLAA